jgi:hypothetical protein
MNKIIVMMWIDQKKSAITRKLNMGVLSITSATDQLQLLEELIDDFNLELVTEDVDYSVEKNF